MDDVDVMPCGSADGVVAGDQSLCGLYLGNELGGAWRLPEAYLGAATPPVIAANIPVPIAVFDDVFHRLKPSKGAAWPASFLRFACFV